MIMIIEHDDEAILWLARLLIMGFGGGILMMNLEY
jgi:hypothetical protein